MDTFGVETEMSRADRRDLIELMTYLSYILLALSALLLLVSYLLRVTNKKRTKIYELSQLLDEVMVYMERSSKDDKRKYEYFVDSLAEKQAARRRGINL